MPRAMIASRLRKRLIAAGADVNAKEANGIWPLLMAISNDNMVRRALSGGTRQQRHGRTGTGAAHCGSG